MSGHHNSSKKGESSKGGKGKGKSGKGKGKDKDNSDELDHPVFGNDGEMLALYWAEEPSREFYQTPEDWLAEKKEQQKQKKQKKQKK